MLRTTHLFFASSRCLLIVLALVLGFHTSYAATHLGNGVYTMSPGDDYVVEGYEYANLANGGPEYFMLTRPKVGTSPYPVIIFNNPYFLFPGPPSKNQADIEWTNGVNANPNYGSVDKYRTNTGNLIPCRDVTMASAWNPNECPMGIFGVASTDVYKNSNVGGEPKSNNTVDWALKNGYAVATAYHRFYAGHDWYEGLGLNIGMIKEVKAMPGLDPNRVGITGVSGGGGASVYPLATPEFQESIAAAVPEATPIDWRKLYELGFVTMRAVQPPSMYQQTYTFMANFFNIFVGVFGRNPLAASWDRVTLPYLATHYNTPALFITSTDDAMCPYTQSVDLNNALKAAGKTSNIWIYQNGPVDYASAPIQNLAHGIYDATSPVKRGFIRRNYFLHRMAPNVSEVVYNHPSDFDIYATFVNFRQAICADPASKQNVSDLMMHAANPIIRYASSDTNVPAGRGETTIAGVINKVWSAEGVQWNASNVRNNLQTGKLPNCGQDVGAPSAPTNAALVSPTSTSLGLTWGASTDNVGVVGYNYDLATDTNFNNLVRNNVDAGSALSVSITGLTPSTVYFARVRARDAAGNVSANSNTTSGSTAAPPNNPPIGYFDSADCSTLVGWTFDPDSSSTSIDVHVYDGSTYLLSAPANVLRTDVNSAYSITGNHGYSIPVPASIKTGTIHTLHVYGIDTSGGNNPELTNSPRTINCPAAITPPTNVTFTNPTTTGLTLNWSGATGAIAGYRYYIATDINFNNHVYSHFDAGLAASINVTGLAPGQTYYGRVRAYDAGGNLSAYSPTATGTTANAPPTILTAAAASPNPVTGTLTNLTVLGADDGGEPNLTYTWATTGTPPAAVTFGATNGTNAGKSLTATFNRAGTYNFQVTLRDQPGASVTSNVTVTVNQTLTTINVTPPSQTVTVPNTVQFSAVGLDQFNQPMSASYSWSVTGGGTITPTTGLFTAATVGGPFTVAATSGGKTGNAQVTVNTVANQAPTIANAAAANPNPVTAFSTNLSVLGADDGGEANLTYTWATIGTPPATVNFPSTNGTNAGKNMAVPFTRAGAYTFQVTIRDVPGASVTSNVTVTVNQILTLIDITPQSPTVTIPNTVQFSASGTDQFGQPMTASYSWSVTGGGTINPTTGLFTATTVSALNTVTATSGGKTGMTQVTVVNAANQNPTVASPAAANPNPVPGLSTNLTVLGADDGGEVNLTYSWATTGTPPAAVTFGATNGTNAGKSLTATFIRAGTYNFQVTIRDQLSASVTSNISVTVNQTLTSISVTPTSPNVAISGTVQFTATGVDQFNQSMTASYSWTVSGGGTMGTTTGLFTATTAGGPFTVTAAAGGKTGTAQVTVLSGPDTTAPSVPSNANFGGATSTSLDLSWAASTDNVAVTGYSYDLATTSTFNPLVRSNVNAGNNLNATITGLNPSTVYYARVRAYDAAGNVSANGPTISAQTLVSTQGGGTSAVLQSDMVRVRPNPWRGSRHGSIGITFDQIPDSCTIKIYSVDGQHVQTLTSAGGSATWDRRNSSGSTVASGIYLYLITDTQGNKARGRFVVVQ